MADARLPQLAEGEVHALRRAVGELTLLNELSVAISGATDLDEIIAMIATRATEAVGAQQVVLTMIDRTAMTPAGTIFRTTGSKDPEHFHLTRSLLGCMCHEKRPLLINDAPSDPRLKGVPMEPWVQNLLCVPLTLDTELIAVLSACNKQDGGRFDEDDQRLLGIMALQSVQVLERARLLKDEAANAHLHEDLLVAERIQTCLLPSGAPIIPGYDVAGTSVSAREVGGDYYDFIPLDGDHWGLVLGDVSGKGISAALLMSNLQAMLRGQAPSESRCRRFVRWCNRQLFLCTPLDKFATLFYGMLDPVRHELTYSNAGHERPFLLVADRPPERLCTGGLALGILADTNYSEETVEIGLGDTLVVFSDGVTDLVDGNDEPFGEERLLATLERARGLPAARMIDRVTEALNEYAGSAPAFDDVTLLVVRRVP